MTDLDEGGSLHNTFQRDPNSEEDPEMLVNQTF
jgi:hypothetical protein